MGGGIMPIPSKNKSEMIGRNLRSVTPPIDYPVENGGFEEIQSSPSSKNMSKNIKNITRMTNEDTDNNQDQVVFYIDGRRIVKKKKRKCIKCKLVKILE